MRSSSEAKIWFKDQLNVSRETLDRLSAYEALLRKWNPAINLVSKSTLSEIWTRHFIDSAQIWSKRPDISKKWCDLGAGGGFPGLVISILAAEFAPGQTTTLVESDARKSSFLMTVARELDLKARVECDRAENLSPQYADCVSARALAPLPALLEMSSRHISDTGTFLFLKGKTYQNELTDAQKYWTFDCEIFASETGSGGVILKIGGLQRV